MTPPTPPTPPTALTVAGTDSGGGAGISADLRTFFASGVHGMLAVAAVTVQNSLAVHGFHEIPPDVVAAQVEAVATDIGVGAAKTGMLATADIIVAVAEAFRATGIGAEVPLVVDPVAASMHGDPLLRADALEALRSELFPLATLVTPNLDEVRLLTGVTVTAREDMHKAADAVLSLGAQRVLIKAGHLADGDCVDLLAEGDTVTELPGPRFDTPYTHGGGDTLAAAITAALARGADVADAVRYGKWFVGNAVRHGYPHGAGVGPVSAFWRLADDPHLP